MADVHMELDSRYIVVCSVSSKTTRPEGVSDSQPYEIETYSAGIRTMTELPVLNHASRIAFGSVGGHDEIKRRVHGHGRAMYARISLLH
jgi:hypothetical protein